MEYNRECFQNGARVGLYIQTDANIERIRADGDTHCMISSLTSPAL